MLSANVIECLGLRILNIAANGGQTITHTNLRGVEVKYLTPLILGHIYLYHYKYKFTAGSSNPTLVQFFWGNTSKIDTHYLNLNKSDSGVLKEDIGIFSPGSDGNPFWAESNLGSWTHGAIYADYALEGIYGWTNEFQEIFVADVTEIYYRCGFTTHELLLNYITSSYSSKNLYKLAGGENTSLIMDEYYLGPLHFKKSYCESAKFIECDGMTAYSVTEAIKDCYFDESDFTKMYNFGTFPSNSNPLSKKLVIDTSSPFYPKHQYVLQIKTTNADISTGSTSDTCWPKLGGIYTTWLSKANMIVVEKVVAKIPVGYNLRTSQNTLGTGWKCEPTSLPGTGEYEEYTFKYTCGSSGTFSTGGFLYIDPVGTNVDKNNVTWYIAYINYCDLTDTGIADWCAMPGSVKIKDLTLYTSEIDSLNLFLNGDGSDTNMPLPSKYKWVSGEYHDLEGWNAIMLPSTTSTAQSEEIVGPKMPINPLSRYKLSCRIWADGANIDYFLMALPYYRTLDDSSIMKVKTVLYRPGTRTTLSADAEAGAKSITVASSDNWEKDCLWSGVGFRNSNYRSYFNTGVQTESAGTVSAINGNVLILRTGLTAKHTKGEYVYLAQDTSTFYYPISRNMLPIKEWKKFEICFGKPDEMWDGRGYSWVDIPWDARYMGLIPNLYANNSGSPIIFDNIRIEEVYTPAEKKDLKVQIKRFGKRRGLIYSSNNTTLYNVKLKSDLFSGFTVTANNIRLTKATDTANFRAEQIIKLSCIGSCKVTENGTPYIYTFDKFSSGNTILKTINVLGTTTEFFYYEQIASGITGSCQINFTSNITWKEMPGELFMGWTLVAFKTGTDTMWMYPLDGIATAAANGDILDMVSLSLGSSSYDFGSVPCDLVVYNAVLAYMRTLASGEGLESLEYQNDIEATCNINLTYGSVTISNNQFQMPEHDVVLDIVYSKQSIPNAGT